MKINVNIPPTNGKPIEMCARSVKTIDLALFETDTSLRASIFMTNLYFSKFQAQNDRNHYIFHLCENYAIRMINSMFKSRISESGTNFL